MESEKNKFIRINWTYNRLGMGQSFYKFQVLFVTNSFFGAFLLSQVPDFLVKGMAFLFCIKI
jgi:hypothetical protein